MKYLKGFFESNRKRFSEGGRFEKLHPFYDAVETFFFIPGIVTRTEPHVRDSLDLKRFMSMVIVALIPPLLFGIYNTGYQSNLASGLPVTFMAASLKGLRIVLPIIIVSYAVGLAWETLFASIRKHNISEGFLVTGLLFPLTLPPTIPLWQVALGISFGVIFGKEIFGGTGRNFLNPALTGRAFLFFAYPIQMSGDAVWTVVSSVNSRGVDTFSGATPLALSAVQGSADFIKSLLLKAGFTDIKIEDKDGNTDDKTFDYVLMSVGRKPDTAARLRFWVRVASSTSVVDCVVKVQCRITSADVIVSGSNATSAASDGFTTSERRVSRVAAST